jgi:hypothetical protein
MGNLQGRDGPLEFRPLPLSYLFAGSPGGQVRANLWRDGFESNHHEAFAAFAPQLDAELSPPRDETSADAAHFITWSLGHKVY